VKTSGRGQKGQKARTGSHIPAYFEGGQNRFSQRMPYLSGFKNNFRKQFATVNLTQLRMFEAGSEVNAEALAERGLIRRSEAGGLLKILGDGEVDRVLKVTAHKVTEGARSKIEAAGGSVTLIDMKRRRFVRGGQTTETQAQRPRR
jgi:large subunit ribosomal protein L15